jgi:hypothetical protein
MSRTASISVLVVGALALGLACSKEKQQAEKQPMGEKDYMVMGEYVNAQDSLPRLRYFDGSQVSLNDRCPNTKAKLNPKMPPIYVNGQPIGFC